MKPQTAYQEPTGPHSKSQWPHSRQQRAVRRESPRKTPLATPTESGNAGSFAITPQGHKLPGFAYSPKRGDILVFTGRVRHRTQERRATRAVRSNEPRHHLKRGL